MAIIIKGSGLGSASYVVTASELHPVTPGNSAVNVADDTYLVIPAANVQSGAAEIAEVENTRWKRTIYHLIGLNQWRFSSCRRGVKAQ